MKGRAKRSMGGGVAPKDPPPKTVYSGAGSNVVKEAEERKRGGRVAKEGKKVEGKMSKMRLDRPGRKTGGRVGADRYPLSEASRISDRSDSKEMDC